MHEFPRGTNPENSLMQLPLDVLRIIAVLLDFESFRHYTLTCKRLFPLYHDMNIWQSRLIREFPTFLSRYVELITPSCMPSVYFDLLAKSRKRRVRRGVDESIPAVAEIDVQIKALEQEKAQIVAAHKKKLLMPYNRVVHAHKSLGIKRNYKVFELNTNDFERVRDGLDTGMVKFLSDDSLERQKIATQILEDNGIQRQWPVDTLIRITCSDCSLGPRIPYSLFLLYEADDDEQPYFNWPQLPQCIRREIENEKWSLEQVYEIYGDTFTPEELEPVQIVHTEDGWADYDPFAHYLE